MKGWGWATSGKLSPWQRPFAMLIREKYEDLVLLMSLFYSCSIMYKQSEFVIMDMGGL